MSIEQYQRKLNSLDKEIANLEKKKADSDKKAANALKHETSITISKNASATTIKNKISQQERYHSEYIKASKISADLQGKIADKRKARNDVSLKLQKEQQSEEKKRTRESIQLQESYESRIKELQEQTLNPVRNSQVESTQEEQNLLEYDVFVSHAWEDKESFVDEFVEELRKLGANVWYDTTQMKWGDSMRAKIDDGLRKSQFGVVVLSPDYIAESKYWTKTELDGLFQMESINGKTLLPIWHKLTKQQVMDYSPTIASKLAMSTATMTAHEIAEELIRLLPEKEEK